MSREVRGEGLGFMSGGGRVQVEKCWVLRLVKVKQKSIGGLSLII